MRLALASIFLLVSTCSWAQSDSTRTPITEQQMRQAAAHIVHFSGLSGNFRIQENDDVKSAVSFIKGKERWIEYNPVFMAHILDSTVTRWSAVSILAHEIGHHLMGHTLDPASLSLGNELECDRYSGFILQKMGAGLEDALAAIAIGASEGGSATHPPRHARVEAITRGWRDASELDANPVVEPFTAHNFTHRITFKGDPHAYFATTAGELVWVDATGEPLVLGQFAPTDLQDYHFAITWDAEKFLVDGHQHIWARAPYNVWRIVGEVKQL